jgi:nitronate monooxygenase
MNSFTQAFLKHSGVEYPLICGAMYPCSNPELVAAVSEAGALGIVQPLSLTYVYGYEFRKGLAKIRSLTAKPIGLNLLIEASSKIYMDRMKKYLHESLEEGVRFFVTALGNPEWVCREVHRAGGVVYHDVTEKKWAQRAVDAGVDGLICVNNLAGGHAGTQDPKRLFEDLLSLGKPLVCAGGVGDRETFVRMLELGYGAVQAGTRFVASLECQASKAYKDAIVNAHASDIVLTERLTGVPVSVIRTPWVTKLGTSAGPLARWMLSHRKFKHWRRLYYSIKSFRDFKRSITQPKTQGSAYEEYWQAGRSVGGIHSIESAGEIVRDWVRGLSPGKK